MKEKFPLSFRIIQQIKAQEYERFFSQLPEYELYMNHLGEIRWLKPEEALTQHEFFSYSLSAWEHLKKRFRLSRKLSLSSMHQAERELRLHFRKYLAEKYLPEKKLQQDLDIPRESRYALDFDDLENIPISLDGGREEIWKRVILIGTALFVLILATSIVLWRGSGKETGQLLVRTSAVDGRVYLNGANFLGYSNKVIEKVPLGYHQISVVKRGYSTNPPSQEIEILSDSLAIIDFVLRPVEAEFNGYVKIISKFKDTKIFLDDRFYGDLQDTNIFALNPGSYVIGVRKDGYLSVPPERSIEVRSGDTLIYNVQQVPVNTSPGNLSTTYSENIGSIEVLSNVKGARINLNGRNTGETTDHIFTQLPLGSYTVLVEKDGYGVDPQSRTLTLSRNNPAGNASFTMQAEMEKVNIRTVPEKGKIFINEDLKATGRFEGMLPVGKHRISFGELDNYIKPKPRDIDVRAGSPVTLTENYFPQVKITAFVNNLGNVIKSGCEVLSGYTFKDRAFTSSQEGGPSIEFNDKMKDYYWKLGFAFPYRNPKGNDALKIEFELPRNLDYDQKFTLRLYAASSKEKYPLSLSGNIDIEIKFNNNVLSYYYKPKYIEDLADVDLTEWDISSFVRGGLNILEISTTDKNNNYFFVKKIEIYN